MQGRVARVSGSFILLLVGWFLVSLQSVHSTRAAGASVKGTTQQEMVPYLGTCIMGRKKRGEKEKKKPTSNPVHTITVYPSLNNNPAHVSGTRLPECPARFCLDKAFDTVLNSSVCELLLQTFFFFFLNVTDTRTFVSWYRSRRLPARGRSSLVVFRGFISDTDRKDQQLSLRPLSVKQ